MVDSQMRLPELYTSAELDGVEAHVAARFGPCEYVLHEIASPDIHVDIYVIGPTPGRDYHTLVTVGMGAHRMNVPDQLRDPHLDRAEVLVTLPLEWTIPGLGRAVPSEDDERWYWPLRWLKILARLPGDLDTWLGYGHTVPNGRPFADNTELSGVLLTMPYLFGPEAHVCALPGGDEIKFYQMVPLYEEEMDYKVEHGVDALEDLFPPDFDMVVDSARRSVLRRGERGQTTLPLRGD